MLLIAAYQTKFSKLTVTNRSTRLLVELLVDHVENLDVDGQHEEQRGQHPAEEVEVDHVVHADDCLELTDHQEVVGDLGAVVTEMVQVIPAQHGREAHYDGHQPAQ